MKYSFVVSALTAAVFAQDFPSTFATSVRPSGMPQGSGFGGPQPSGPAPSGIQSGFPASGNAFAAAASSGFGGHDGPKPSGAFSGAPGFPSGGPGGFSGVPSGPRPTVAPTQAAFQRRQFGSGSAGPKPTGSMGGHHHSGGPHSGSAFPQPSSGANSNRVNAAAAQESGGPSPSGGLGGGMGGGSASGFPSGGFGGDAPTGSQGPSGPQQTGSSDDAGAFRARARDFFGF